MLHANGDLIRQPVSEALARCRGHFVAAALFSAVSNLLYLTPSLYMMQVYDRVVPTGGLATLAAISIVALGGLATLAALEWVRGRLLVRAGAKLEAELAGPLLTRVLTHPELSRIDRAQAMHELEALRGGISSSTAVAIFDAPWTAIYILVAWLLHPALGLLAFFSGVALLALAWSNERSTYASTRDAAVASNAAYARQSHAVSFAAEVRALGMGGALTRRQLRDRSEVSRLQAASAFTGGNHMSLIKFLRLSLQSAALGLGALLVVRGELSGGAMLAASLLLSRALAPIELIVSAWKSILQSRQAYRNLSKLLPGEAPREHTRLPAPSGALRVERLVLSTPQEDRVAVADASFQVAAGEIIGLVGASGAGKTSLLRALAGAAVPRRGSIRFDGAASTDWESDQLACHIGYLPQNFVLFAGTVKENISRFRVELDEDAAQIDAAVIRAAQGIGAHEMILRLPNGYDTPIGSGNLGLSAGQTQRIAIARALFGDPCILLLDEPTAHLDAEAQHAFMKALSAARVAGTTVIFATHSGDILASADKLLLMRDGRVERFTPLADAMPTLRQPVTHDPRKARS